MRLTIFLPLALLPATLLTGCSVTSVPTPATTPVQASLKGITGNIHGGRQPIIGAHVFVLAAGTSANAGYYSANSGSSGLIPASTANASASLLTSGSNTTLDTTTTDATFGDYYVTSDANGNFSLNGDYTCTAGTQIYLYALGGQPTTGITNAAAGLISALGQCPSTKTMAATTPFALINEVSTVAAAYALAGYATDALHISSSGSALATTGIANAFTNAANLFDISAAHGPTALAKTPAGNGTVPQTTLDALANSLAACVNSTGSASTQCTTLFKEATSDGVFCASPPCTGQPTDTATAAINIAHYPSARTTTSSNTTVSDIFGLAAGIGTPYLPTLSAAPNDFSIGINFAVASLSEPYGIAIDASGNTWIASPHNNSVARLSSTGAVLSGTTGYTTDLSDPVEIAIDLSGNAFVQSSFLYNYTEYSNNGAFLTTSATSNDGEDIAIDASGNVWFTSKYENCTGPCFYTYYYDKVANPGGAILASDTMPTSQEGSAMAIDGNGNAWMATTGILTEYSSSGSLLSGANGFTNAGIGTSGIAIDSSGNVWTASHSGNVAKVNNSGTALSGTSGFTLTGLALAQNLAIDGAGNVWVPGGTSSVSTIVEASSSGATLSGSTGYQGGSLDDPVGVAVDGSGDIWVSNLVSNTVTELIGAAVPVITPIAAGLPTTPNANGSSNLGTRP